MLQSGDEKGAKSSAGKIGHDMMWQMKLLDLSMSLLGTLRYNLGMTF